MHMTKRKKAQARFTSLAVPFFNLVPELTQFILPLHTDHPEIILQRGAGAQKLPPFILEEQK